MWERDGLFAIATVSDTQVSWEHTDAVSSVRKSSKLSETWSAMMSGDNIGLVAPVLAAVTAELNTIDPPHKPEAVATAFKNAYAGRELEFGFIAYGFDGITPHILVINQDGEALHDVTWFAAIGSGRDVAQKFLEQNAKFDYAKETVSNICYAKFLAENTPYVGKGTIATLRFSNGWEHPLADDDLRRVWSLWRDSQKAALAEGANSLAPAIEKAAHGRRSLDWLVKITNVKPGGQ